MDFVRLTPVTKEQYHQAAAHIRAERGGDCLTLGATQSASGGTMWGGGPIMMTTWELDEYPFCRVEQTNPGEKLTHDERDVWRYWVNEDHLWRAI
jgi:hypothetical protein